MLNPILQALNQSNQAINNINNLKNLLSGKDPNAMLQIMLQTNPQFKQFYELNKGKSAEEIANSYGLDYEQVKALLYK